MSPRVNEPALLPVKAYLISKLGQVGSGTVITSCSVLFCQNSPQQSNQKIYRIGFRAHSTPKASRHISRPPMLNHKPLKIGPLLDLLVVINGW